MFEYKIKEVVKVVDGDTVDVFIDLGFNIFHVERLRLNRVDAPETLTKDKNEKKYGMEAKSFVSDWLKEQKKIKIQTFKDDKYGRILAEFIGDGNICLNDLLLNEGYAWSYDGNAKITDLTLLEAKRKPKS